MLEASARSIVERLSADELVLDVGGWGSPFERADWVLDLMPFETRGLYGYDRTSARERFSSDTWVQADICDHEPWPFDDDQFDFAVCSHTLEDIRDPLWVCRELQRVARAGYIETPSRAEEQSWGVHGPWVGWSHHRWLVDVVDGRLRFAMKPGALQERGHFPAGHADQLEPLDRVVQLWWEGSFEVEERQFFEADDLDRYLREVESPEHTLVAARTSTARRGSTRPAWRRLVRRAARPLRRAISR